MADTCQLDVLEKRIESLEALVFGNADKDALYPKDSSPSLQVSYNFKIKVDKTGAPVISHCECPAGKGPHATCKHIAAVLLMAEHFISTGSLLVERSCTENLQTFHKPKSTYKGSPVKAESLPSKRKWSDKMLEDPRPLKYRRMAGYDDYVRNMMVNFCSTTSQDISLRYLHPKADLQTAVQDHDYLEKPFSEYWVDRALQCIENLANLQSKIFAATAPRKKIPKAFEKLPDLRNYLDPSYTEELTLTGETKGEIILAEEEYIRKQAGRLENMQKMEEMMDSEHIRAAPKLSGKLQELCKIQIKQQDDAAKFNDEARNLLESYNSIVTLLSKQFVQWDETLTQLEMDANPKKSKN